MGGAARLKDFTQVLAELYPRYKPSVLPVPLWAVVALGPLLGFDADAVKAGWGRPPVYSTQK